MVRDQQSVGGRLGNHNAVLLVEQVTGPKSSTSSFQCIHHDVLQPVQYDTTKIFLWLLSSAVSAIFSSNILIAFCRDRL